MPVKERLGEDVGETSLEGMDDLDLAYLKELKDHGISESLLEQFQSIAIEMQEEKKENK